MCFGNQVQQQKTTQTTSTPSPAVAAGANTALGFATNLLNQGFTPYGGQMVAGPSGQQQSSWNMANLLATGGVPYVGQASNLITNYANAGPQSVTPSTISSAMSPYMNQYVMQALAPQIEAQNQQFAAQNQQLNTQATSSGAFGDARAGIQAANLSQQQDIARTGLIGNAYTSAFNTAIGAGAQDVSNALNAQTINANLQEQALQRQLSGAGALQQLGGYQLGQGTNLANLQNIFGQQQTAQNQAQLNAQYQQYLMGLQYPFQSLGALNQTVGVGAAAMPPSTNQVATTVAPDNSGFQLAGSIFGGLAGNSGFGTALGGFLFSERDMKYDIKKVGETDLGPNIYAFKYKGDPTGRPRVGMMADEIEKHVPAAIIKLSPRGPRLVNYTAIEEALGKAA